MEKFEKKYWNIIVPYEKKLNKKQLLSDKEYQRVDDATTHLFEKYGYDGIKNMEVYIRFINIDGKHQMLRNNLEKEAIMEEYDRLWKKYDSLPKEGALTEKNQIIKRLDEIKHITSDYRL